MKEDVNNELIKTIVSFKNRFKSFLPTIETGVNDLIENQEKNALNIELLLDVLLQLKNFGIDDTLFLKLLDYYKTVDIESAKFYEQEFNREN